MRGEKKGYRNRLYLIRAIVNSRFDFAQGAPRSYWTKLARYHLQQLGGLASRW